MFKGNDDLFVPLGHFYSPVPDREEVRQHLDKQENASPPVGINFRDTEMRAHWQRLLPTMKGIPFTDEPSSDFRYNYINDQFSFGDADILYAMLATHRPKRLIEIGSGYSSAVALDARMIEKLDVQLTFIEPYPDRLETLLRPEDKATATIIEKKVQDVDLDVFMSLEAGDFLFIDSSHVVKTGSDVCYEILEILPNLAPGVIVAIHDMFYPFEYPKGWCLDENRGWNELYLVRAMLMHSQRYEIKFFNHYFALHHSDLASDQSVNFHRNSGGTLWLDIVE